MVIFHSYVSLPEGYHIWTPGRDDALRTIHSSSEIAAMGAWRPMDFSNGKGGWMAHHGSMVLLYMVCHGSHQYTPFMLAYIYTIHGPYGWRISMEDVTDFASSNPDFLGDMEIWWEMLPSWWKGNPRKFAIWQQFTRRLWTSLTFWWTGYVDTIDYLSLYHIYMIWYAYTLNINI